MRDMTLPLRQLARTAALLALLAPCAASAQEKLVGASTFSTGLLFDNWSLPTAIGAAGTEGSGMISGGSQVTVPLGLVIPLHPRWTVDMYTAYTRGSARLAVPDAAGRTSYQLNGLTDSKIRVVGALVEDAVLLTAGVNLPTGRSTLSPEQLGAFSLLSAPSLRFRSPVLGTGAGATLGVILARSIAEWGMALATTYEARGSYAPAEALAVGTEPASLRVGNAVHLSLAGDRLIGSTHHTLSLTGDLFQQGSIGDPAQATSETFALGPSVAATYQLDATLAGSETTVFAVARRRAEYKFAGVAVPGSSRTELDGGAQVLHLLSPESALRLGADLRYAGASAGLDTTVVENVGNFSSAGVRAIGLSAGLRRTGASGWAMEPFLRAQLARLDFGSQTRTAVGLSGGASVTTRF